MAARQRVRVVTIATIINELEDIEEKKTAKKGSIKIQEHGLMECYKCFRKVLIQ